MKLIKASPHRPSFLLKILKMVASSWISGTVRDQWMQILFLLPKKFYYYLEKCLDFTAPKTLVGTPALCVLLG